MTHLEGEAGVIVGRCIHARMAPLCARDLRMISAVKQRSQNSR
jgi:hypothetical protein